jgi:hypothetical protein
MTRSDWIALAVGFGVMAVIGAYTWVITLG